MRTIVLFSQKKLCVWLLNITSPLTHFLFGITSILLTRKKTLFLRHWFESDILLVGQLLNSDGQLLTINERCLKFKCHISVKDYSVVMNSISVKILSLFRNHGSWCNTVGSKVSKHLFLDKFDLLNDNCSNQLIRSLFVNISSPPSKFVWVNMFPSFEFLVGIVLQIKPKKCPLKLLTEYILLKKH